MECLGKTKLVVRRNVNLSVDGKPLSISALDVIDYQKIGANLRKNAFRTKFPSPYANF